MTGANVIKTGATRKGKTLAAARSILESPGEAAIILDPHKQSLANAVLTHATGNILYERLSDVRARGRVTTSSPNSRSTGGGRGDGRRRC